MLMVMLNKQDVEDVQGVELGVVGGVLVLRVWVVVVLGVVWVVLLVVL
jgi:hypothetical protein